MADQTLGLTDDEYWENPGKAKAAAGALADANFGGVAVGAPATVPIDLRDTLPVVALRAGTIADLWAVSFDRHAFWTSMDLGRNRLTAGAAGDPEFEEVAANPEDAPSGYMVEPRVTNFREVPGMAWEPGKHLITVIMRERVSNRAAVVLKYSAGKFQDPEVAKFLEAKRAAPAPPVVSPPSGDPYPLYQKRDDSPPLPGDPGLAVTADRVVVQAADARAVVRGAFRLKPLPHEVVKPPAAGAGVAVAAGQPTAVVGIYLFVTGADSPAAGVVELRVPSYDPVPPNAKDPVVTGYFAVDLLELGVIPELPQTVFVYAFSGEFMEGPFPVGFVAEGAVPK